VTALHSRYNPQGEAERYLAAIPIPPHIRCFLLIEPGLGYMIPVLAGRFPKARLIVLHVEPQGPQGASGGAPGQNSVYWDPSHPLALEAFLERELEAAAGGEGFFGAESVKIIEWRPSRDHYGERYLRLLAAAAALIRRFDAGRRTLRAFGRRWFRNFFRNLSLLRSFPRYPELRTPVLVTGAGPSLEESLPLIAELKKKLGCFIIAAASSVPALLYRGLIPNLALSTDGGGWALLHLYELFRRPPEGPEGAFALAAAFCARLPSQCQALPLLGIADGSLWQTLILRGLGIPHLVLPQRGTVTASALDLAFALGRGKVYIAGMDLDTQDILTHVRPYAFDRLWREEASRFSVEYGQRFARGLALREGGSHRVYAEWFGSQLASYPDRLGTLGKNNPLFGRLPRLEYPLGPGAADSKPPPFTPVPVRPADRAAALAILKTGLEDRATAPSLMGELGPLLFPGAAPPGPGELWAEIESLAGAARA
jgi:hypothetical protein